MGAAAGTQSNDVPKTEKATESPSPVAVPEATEENEENGKYTRVAKTAVIVTTYILLSAGLIRYNKFLVDKHRFPFPMVLTALHMGGSSVLSWLLFLVAPSFFPSAGKAAENWRQLLRMLLPIALTFAVTLYFSNLAYMYCGVAFLQFMKEANVVIVFMMSCLAGLQEMSRERFVTIIWIIACSSLAVSGDLHFLWIGVAIQVASQLAECCKAVLAELVLGKDFKLDPLTYTMCVAPLCLCMLSVGVYMTWTPKIVPGLMTYWRLLVPNVLLAFCMNVTVAIMFKVTSAMGVILAGVVKDIFIVVASAAIFGEKIVPVQWVSFLLTTCGIFWWSYMKLEPDSPAVKRFGEMLGRTADHGEAQALLSSKKV